MINNVITDLDKIRKNSYGVIGNPIEHSLSPVIHNGLSDENNYVKILLEPNKFDNSIPLLKERLKGFNCTIPYKQQIIKHIDVLDDTAMLYGAVNTVKVKENKLYGYNTDGYGFLKAIQFMNINLNNSKVLLIGAGGVARIIAYETVKANCELDIFARNKYRANLLKKDIEKIFTNSQINIIDNLKDNYDLIVNATPVGMYPNINYMPIDENTIKNSKCVFDTIYNPIETKMLKVAINNGIKYSNGLYMLVYQAVYSRYIWNNESYSNKELNKIIEILNKML